MPTRFRFDLASEGDDVLLREVLRRTSIPGGISLSFQREPYFFTAERAGNLDSQVIVARDTVNGSIVGLGSRGLRRAFVDGQEQICGYLSGLRGLPEVRRGLLLARGYRFLKHLHNDGRIPYYFTTILDNNAYAKEILTSRRAGLPVYHPLGHFYTYLLPLYSVKIRRKAPAEIIQGGVGNWLAKGVECLNTFNRSHQLAPCYTIADFHGVTGTLPKFNPENDWYGYQDGSRVIATLGVWDQNSFKQTVVAGYSWPYRMIRPFCAAGFRWGLNPWLPPIGRPFPYLFGAFLSHLAGGESALEELIQFVLSKWAHRGYSYLALGVHEDSRLNNLLGRLAASRQTSTIYLVYWEDLLECQLPSSELTPHLEVATL